MRPVPSIAIGLLVSPVVAIGIMAAASQAANATTTPATASTRLAHDWDGAGNQYGHRTWDPRWDHNRWDPRWNWRRHHHHHHWNPRGGWHR